MAYGAVDKMKELIAEWFGEELDMAGARTLYLELEDELNKQMWFAMERIMKEGAK